MSGQYLLQLILSCVSLFILVSIYYYLNQLKSCDCFIQNQKEGYMVNIEFLKFYQLLEIFALFIFVVLITLYKKKLFKGGGTGIKFLISLSMIVLLFITGYVSYNTILVYLTTTKDCKCDNKWQKYILYLQGVMNSVYFLRLLYILSFIILILIFNKKKN